MKKLILLFLVAFTALNSLADELSDLSNKHGQLLATAIVKETNGYLIEEQIYEDMYSSFIQLPDYYDCHNIIMTINNIIEALKYTIVKPWSACDDGVLSSYKLGNSSMINFRFDEKRHFILILTQVIRE